MDIQPENQFDFWLGEWEACWNEDEKGTNRVTRILDGKIIQEDFSAAPAAELHGLSFSAYDAERKLWRQTWVDNSGSYLDFTGAFIDGKMILSRIAIVRGEKCKQRMVCTTSSRIDLTGTGNARMTRASPGACCGRSNIHVKNKSL